MTTPKRPPADGERIKPSATAACREAPRHRLAPRAVLGPFRRLVPRGNVLVETWGEFILFLMPQASGLDPWYVTGLVEGEGTFTYSRSGAHMALYFAVKLVRADDDLLISLREFFGGVGTIYRVRPRAPRPRAGHTKAASYYRVCRQDQLRRIVEHFDAYPLKGAKAASYAIWRLMVLLKLEFPKTAGDRLDLFAKK